MLSDIQIQRLLDIANTACHRGDVSNARPVYEGILALRPGFIPALVGQALSYIVVDDSDMAEAILKGVLETVPEDPDANTMLGLCYLLSQRKEEAATVLQPIAEGEGAAAALAAALLEQARS